MSTRPGGLKNGQPDDDEGAAQILWAIEDMVL